MWLLKPQFYSGDNVCVTTNNNPIASPLTPQRESSSQAIYKGLLDLPGDSCFNSAMQKLNNEKSEKVSPLCLLEIICKGLTQYRQMKVSWNVSLNKTPT